MNFVRSSDVFLIFVQDEFLEICVSETVSERVFWVNFVRLEKILGCLVGFIAVPSPGSNSGINPIYQSVVSDCKWSFFVGKNVINSSFTIVGKLLECIFVGL